MDTNSVTNATVRAKASRRFGLAMPILAQDWVDRGRRHAECRRHCRSVEDHARVGQLGCALHNRNSDHRSVNRRDHAGDTAEFLRPGAMDAVGAPPGIGTTPPAPGGVLLTMFETAWLRLCWLYANVLETASTAQPQQANGLPCRQVPRYFFYPTQTTFPGQTTNQTSGIADAGDPARLRRRSLDFRQ